MTPALRRSAGAEWAAGGPDTRQRLNFDALIFDVDGTLADTEETHRQAFNEAFCAFSLDWDWTPALYDELLQVTGGKERIASYIDRLEIGLAERRRLKRLVPQIHGTKTRLYKELIELGRMRPRPGVCRLMVEALSAGIHLAIASTTTPENVESLITASFGPDALCWFTAIVTGDVVRHKKPAPDIYQLALAAVRLPPQRAIAIEDSAIGVQAAKAAGLFTVATPSAWTARQDFAAADLVLPSLGDPDEPLDQSDEWRIGAKYLGLEQLATFHAAAAHVEGEVCQS